MSSNDSSDEEALRTNYDDDVVFDITGEPLRDDPAAARFEASPFVAPQWGNHLKELVLMHCRMETVPGGAIISATCPGLRKICLRGNLISSIPEDAFAGLSKVVYLDLYENRLSAIPAGLGQSCPKLRVLDVSYNEIRHITGLENLPSLREVYLVQNKIRQIGEGIHAVRSSLKLLELGGNRLRRVENLDGFDLLESLWVGKNKITDLSGLTSLPRLTKLDVQANRVTKLEGLADHATLQELLLSHNGLTSASGLPELPNLTLLDISGNQIESLAGSNLARFSKLEEFWCTSNKLSSFQELEKELSSVPTLTSVMFEQNPLQRDAQYRNKLLLALPHVKQIDADDVVRTGIAALAAKQS